jgi:hypothetical protein
MRHAADWHRRMKAVRPGLPAALEKVVRGVTLMKEIRIALEAFDLEAFLERTLEFLREWIAPEADPIHLIARVQSMGEAPVFGPASGWSVISGLTEGEMVFFPFAYTDGDRLYCADRIELLLFSIDIKYGHEMFIGLEDSIGYLVQIKDRTVLVNSAICTDEGSLGSAPRIDLYPNSGFLEKSMESFIRGFTCGDEAEAPVKCGECGCSEGQLHELGCFWEVCPFCGEQLVWCNCIYEILDLRDDSDELTPEQEERWLEALTKKGRRPFIWWHNVCARCGKLDSFLFTVPDEDWQKYIDPRQRCEVICRDCYLDIRTLIDVAGQ